VKEVLHERPLGHVALAGLTIVGYFRAIPIESTHMGQHDTQEVCLNGHQTTDSYHSFPELRRAFCEKCGAATIHRCPKCSAEIKGDYRVEGVVFFSHDTAPVPAFCASCGQTFPWANTLNDDPVTQLDPAESITRICERLPLVIRQLRERHDSRNGYDVQDEYDLQDLVHALLHLFFDDVRPEEHTPSYAGKAARMDFLLRDASIVIEAKMTRRGLGAKELGDELTIDISRYKLHPDCKLLFCLVYDPEHRVQNPRGIEADLSRQDAAFKVKVLIVPKGI
jgi:hypothetical protein